MKIRYSLIDNVDGKAVMPLAYLIWSYLSNHSNIGCIEIEKTQIRFTKGVFFTVGKILYEPYGLVCRNGIVYFEGGELPEMPKDQLFVILVNALFQLKKGYVFQI